MVRKTESPESSVGPLVGARVSMALASARGEGVRAASAGERWRQLMAGPSGELSGSVLLVEEDPAAGRSLSRLLRRYGFPTRVVASGRTAQAFRSPCAVAVLGVELPDGDGVQVARELLGRGCVRSVIFYTGCSDVQRLRRAAQVGRVCAISDGVVPLLRQLEGSPAHALPAAASQSTRAIALGA